MIKKCLFPAAGYGTRLLPATKSIPKEMYPILNKPLIQYAVEESMAAGIDKMCIVTGRNKDAIANHFDTNYELEHQLTISGKIDKMGDITDVTDKCIFSYTRQKEMLGLGHAILTGETLIGNEPFGVVLADDLCIGYGSSVMAQMIKLYEEHKCNIIAIQEVDPSETAKYGIIEGKLLDENTYRVTNMVEKPDPKDAPSNYAIIGRYVLIPEIFDIIRNTPPGKNGELQITDALMTMAEQGKVIAYKFKGRRFDCGGFDGIFEASQHFYSLLNKGK